MSTAVGLSSLSTTPAQVSMPAEYRYRQTRRVPALRPYGAWRVRGHPLVNLQSGLSSTAFGVSQDPRRHGRKSVAQAVALANDLASGPRGIVASCADSWGRGRSSPGRRDTLCQKRPGRRRPQRTTSGAHQAGGWSAGGCAGGCRGYCLRRPLAGCARDYSTGQSGTDDTCGSSSRASPGSRGSTHTRSGALGMRIPHGAGRLYG
jgi:hypothetical protein